MNKQEFKDTLQKEFDKRLWEIEYQVSSCRDKLEEIFCSLEEMDGE